MTVGRILRARQHDAERLIRLVQYGIHPHTRLRSSMLSSAPAAMQELTSANIGLLATVTVNMIANSKLGISFDRKFFLLVFGGLAVIFSAGFLRVLLYMKPEKAAGNQHIKSESFRRTRHLTLSLDLYRRFMFPVQQSRITQQGNALVSTAT